MDCPFEDPKLNRDEVFNLAAYMATDEEIASYFKTTVDVIEEFYLAEVTRGRHYGRVKIRQLIMDKADKDKDPKAIDALARTYLGMEGMKR